MLYTRRTFTCPASANGKQVDWDMAFLTDAEFVDKYGVSKEDYGTSLSEPICG